jgi:hypothetical protein
MKESTMSKPHGTVSMHSDLFAFCPSCDAAGDDGLVVYGFDEVGGMYCPACNKVMTRYGVSYFEGLPHGTNCAECVAAAPAGERYTGTVLLTPARMNALTDFAQLGDIIAADMASKTKVS